MLPSLSNCCANWSMLMSFKRAVLPVQHSAWHEICDQVQINEADWSHAESTRAPQVIGELVDCSNSCTTNLQQSMDTITGAAFNEGREWLFCWSQTERKSLQMGKIFNALYTHQHLCFNLEIRNKFYLPLHLIYRCSYTTHTHMICYFCEIW